MEGRLSLAMSLPTAGRIAVLLLPLCLRAAPDLPVSRLVQPRSALFADCDGEPRRVPIDPEVVGFSGPRFERFRIHFDSIADRTRDSASAWGRTRFAGSTCDFAGSLRRVSREAGEANSRIPGVLQRNRVRVDLRESNCPHPGRITGELEGFSFVFPEGKVSFATDQGVEICGGESAGNRFRGVWKSLGGKASRRVRWGWRRIPDGEGLDCGPEEFLPCATVEDSSWADYTLARTCASDSSAECRAAREREEWWSIRPR